jgi:hypothetical protein
MISSLYIIVFTGGWVDEHGANVLDGWVDEHGANVLLLFELEVTV